MAIISTFDPKYKRKLYKENVDEFGKDNVILVKKSFLYLINVVIIPFLIVCGFFYLIILISLKFTYKDSTGFFIIMGIIIVIFLTLLYQLFHSSLSYFMGFMLFTPKTFTKYKQKGFFKRDLKIIDLEHIKSVHVQKNGFFESVFDIGSIIVESDGGDTTSDGKSGSIKFKNVRHPERICGKIEKLLSGKI